MRIASAYHGGVSSAVWRSVISYGGACREIMSRHGEEKMAASSARRNQRQHQWRGIVWRMWHRYRHQRIISVYGINKRKRSASIIAALMARNIIISSGIGINGIIAVA